MRHRQIFCQLFKRNSAGGRFPGFHQVLRNRMLSAPVKWNRNRSPLRPDHSIGVSQKNLQNRIVLKPLFPRNPLEQSPQSGRNLRRLIL